ncbi:MAG: TraR/DksA C4-type zinc finger protein [Chthoniobacterales bacterium]
MAVSKKKSSAKRKPAKKAPPKKAPALKPKASVGKAKPAVKKTATRKTAAKKTASKKPAASKRVVPPAKPKRRATKQPQVSMRDMLAFGQPVEKGRRLDPWIKKQQLRLLALKDTLLDSMTGVARDNLRNGNDAHEVSAHGLHQADAGSDSYDRDFALNLLSQEQDALFEINEALQRITRGTYGVCEMSEKKIPKARLEARPFARYTVECQSEMERKNRFSRVRQPVARLFESTDEDGGEDSDEDAPADPKE